MSQATHRIVGVGWGTSLNLIPAIAQLAEHLTVDSGSDQMVPGSIPGGRTFLALRLYAARGASLSCGWVRLGGGRERERESKHCHSGELISIMLTAYIEMHAGIQHVGGWADVCHASSYQNMTVWPSGLRRWLQAPVRKGVGSNPTAVTSHHRPDLYDVCIQNAREAITPSF